MIGSDDAVHQRPFAGSFGGRRGSTPANVYGSGLHRTEKSLKAAFDIGRHTGKVVFEQCPCEFTQQAGRQLALYSGAGHDTVTPGVQGYRTLRLHIPGILENNDAQRRVKPEFGLAQNSTQCEAELGKLTQRLGCGISAIIADRFK